MKKASKKTVVTKKAAAEAAVKNTAPAAEKVETVAAKTETAPVKAETVEKAGAKAEKTKKASAGTAAKKTGTAAKKTTTKKAAVVSKVVLEFSGRQYTHEDLVKIAKDVWKYDHKKKVGDFKSVELYVKPEDSRCYYVINGEVAGEFYI